MNSLMKALDLEQQIWAAGLAIKVIWSDGDLSKEEFDAFSKLTSSIANAGRLNELMKQLETPPIDQQDTALVLLDSVPQALLPQVYQELVGLAICDWALNFQEEKALKEIGSLFRLSATYQKTVLQWAKDGIDWQSGIAQILPPALEIKKFKIPLHQLTDSQRVWFADALLAVFMEGDGIGKEESNLVGQVVRSIEDNQQRSRVIALIKNNLPPHFVAPKEVGEVALYLGLLEIIKVLATNNGLSHRQTNFITNYVKLCQLPEKTADAAIDWAKEGIRWRQAAAMVIKKGSFQSDSDSSLEKSLDRWLPVKENNSLHYREQTCYFCDSTEPIPIFRLVPRTQKLGKNIFGVGTFGGSLAPEQAEVNFHLVSTNVCPECYFASPKKELFKTNTETTAPEQATNYSFLKKWKESADKRKILFPLVEVDHNIKGIPSLEQAISRHQLAVHCAQEFAALAPTEEKSWELANLHLILAELFMSQSKRLEAEVELGKAVAIAKKMMEKTWNTTLSLRASRLLFNNAIYQGDGKTAGEQLNFFIQMKDEKFDTFAADEQSLFLGFFTEVKKTFDDRDSLSKAKLNGFHKKIFEVIKKQDTEGTDGSK